MTGNTGNEQDPPFDLAAAGEAFLEGSMPIDYVPTEEEGATLEAQYAQERTVTEALARHGIDLGLAEGQDFTEELVEVNQRVDTLNGQWERLAARQIAGDVQPGDESRYDQLDEELVKAHEQGELVAMASYIAIGIGSEENPAYDRELLQSALVKIATTPRLTPAQKKVYFDTAEELVGQERFSEAMAEIGRENTLEQEVGRLAAQEGNVSTAAQQLQDIQEFFIQELGVPNILDGEWLSFAKDLQQAAYFQRIESNDPKIQRKLDKIDAAAQRLGVSSETLATLFTQLGIVPRID